MGVANESFQKSDVFIDYDFEEVMFHYDHRIRRFFRKFYDESEEHEIPHDNRLLNDAERFGDEIDVVTYRRGKLQT